jgi:epoxyqueuosine reductase
MNQTRKTENKPVRNEREKKVDRREFLKISAASTALGAMTVAGLSSSAIAGKAAETAGKPQIKEVDEFPYKISPDYKPFPSTNNIFNRALGGHPTLGPLFQTLDRLEYDNNKPGQRQMDDAIYAGAFSLSFKATGTSTSGHPGMGIQSWKQRTKKDSKFNFDHDYVHEHKCKFKTKEEATDAIKRAARLYGAQLVGITKRDPRWDYANHVQIDFAAPGGPKPRIFGWEEFPFEPKTVVVLAFEMDYETMAAAPSKISAAGTAEGYSQMAKSAFQLSVFFKALGYHSVACGNDTGLSVPYAVAAGLGETGRNGIMVTYKYGPRVRLAKVYTDFDFVEYDKPKIFGVHEFCERCMRCADSCPSRAISFDAKPSMAPTHDDPEKWFNNPGVEKYYINAKKCFEYWCKSNTDCAICITSCPYNKPDFWHHRMVDKINALMPGPLHTFMREMDIAFGYGNSFDPKAIKKFYASNGRKYNGF